MWFPSYHNFWHFEHDDDGEKPNYKKYISKHLHDIPGKKLYKETIIIIVIIISDINIIVIISGATLH
jgi:hypothetical protein